MAVDIVSRICLLLSMKTESKSDGQKGVFIGEQGQPLFARRAVQKSTGFRGKDIV